ncbi:MAG: hypothetical protein DELT_00767 [Desulfovibrio sp.]
MRSLLLCAIGIMLCFSLVNAGRYSIPFHYAIIIPAEVIHDFGRGKQKAFEGVKFPLFCGYVSIYPKENKFVFTKRTDIPPIDWLDQHIGQIERDGHMKLSLTLPMPIAYNDPNFIEIFYGNMNLYRIGLYLAGLGYEVPSESKFKKQYPYRAGKEPPVPRGYTLEESRELVVPIGEW